MRKFDWIDFGYSWQEDWASKPVDIDRHRSTACLIAQKLRNRPFAFRKIFLWLTRAEQVQPPQATDVLSLEAQFPFATYSRAAADQKLAIFADWMIGTINGHAPSLLRGPSESADILRATEDENYVYVRKDKILRKDNGARCTAVFTHSPEHVECRITCPRDGIDVSLPSDLFPRDELVYGKAIRTCWVDAGRVYAQTFKGVVEATRN